MTVADVFVGVAALAVAVWIILFVGCASALPAEPPITCTVAASRDR